VERERKYLLAALPPRAAEADGVEIDQGWLPGARLRERIRRVAATDGERFWRGLKQGTGRARLEAEEETTREVFETLWTLTSGRRLTRRRRQVVNGGLTWTIDEVPARDLVLAALEGPASLLDAAVPEWLQPFVVREVSSEPDYRDESLATTATQAAPHDGATPASAAHPTDELEQQPVT
jgi:CYTH domain-containing protein